MGPPRSGAGVGVVLGIPLPENKKGFLVSWFSVLGFQFLGFLVSWFLGFWFLGSKLSKVSKFRKFNDPMLPKFQTFKDSKRYLFHITKFPFHGFLIDVALISKILKI